ncbi:MAG: hypothetical protein HY696_03965 [Deltaproteobacteria bacterium]|nr:hypothetical protein [Deltaproteobacteria bacterium]
MDAKELKTLLDHTGSRIVGKFIRDQQSLIDTFRAEVSRSLDALYPTLVKSLGAKEAPAEAEETAASGTEV